MNGPPSEHPLDKNGGASAIIVRNTPPTSDPGESAVCHVGGFFFGPMTDNTLKPFKTFDEQLNLLKIRGLSVGDNQAALAALERLGYYRLSGYFYPLRKTKPRGEPGRLNEFQDGASMELVVALAEFDKRLRLMTLYAVETIEIAVRVAIGHRLGRHCTEAHLQPSLLDGRFTRDPGTGSRYHDWLCRFEKACKDSKEDFIEHHRKQYGGRLPIWVATEIWDFGMLSRFFSGMQHRDQAAIATSLGVGDAEAMTTWLRAINFARNVAAHHGRLWNRTNIQTPKLPPADRCRAVSILHRNPTSLPKLFGTLTCIRVLMEGTRDDSGWLHQIKAHVQAFPQSPLVNLSMAGFPDGWQDDEFWR